ncbi:GNAT family N-acetyltransferase [Catenovulum sp. SM1970]|nr:GNAT family N-acetyltransferase [Marinifaba aquimaris]
MSLLLLADPCEKQIDGYLKNAQCFAALANNDVIAACIVCALDDDTAEIVNIATQPDYQQKGIGSQLLTFTTEQLAAMGFKELVLGTGTFGYQLNFYQRAGFRVDAVIKDHFLDHYNEAIFENGIQHKDMLRLYKHL